MLRYISNFEQRFRSQETKGSNGWHNIKWSTWKAQEKPTNCGTNGDGVLDKFCSQQTLMRVHWIFWCICNYHDIKDDASRRTRNVLQTEAGHQWSPTSHCLFMKNKVRMFANDTKTWNKIGSFEDSIRLQDDFDRLVQWSELWQLEFNKEKSNVMKIGH